MVQGNSGESIYKNHPSTFNDFIRVWGRAVLHKDEVVEQCSN